MRVWMFAAILILGIGAFGAWRLIGADGISSPRLAAAATEDAEGCQCGESKLSANISRTRTFAENATTLVADLDAEVRRLKALPAAESTAKASDPRAGELLAKLEKANGECGRRQLTPEEAITDEAKQWRGACSQLAQASQEYGRPIEIYLRSIE